jgi:hypothetical protein
MIQIIIFSIFNNHKLILKLLINIHKLNIKYFNHFKSDIIFYFSKISKPSQISNFSYSEIRLFKLL